MFALAAAPRISRRTSFACRAGRPSSRARGLHPRPHRNLPHQLSIHPVVTALRSRRRGGNPQLSLRSSNLHGANLLSSMRRSMAGASNHLQRSPRLSRVGVNRNLKRGGNRRLLGASHPPTRQVSRDNSLRRSGVNRRGSQVADSLRRGRVTCASVLPMD
jgi:hypothetical protein